MKRIKPHKDQCFEEVEVREIFVRFRKHKVCFTISDIIQVVMAILTILSLIAVILTLKEMQKERVTAYKPTALMNAADLQISWNANDEEEWLKSLPNKTNSSYDVNSIGKGLSYCRFWLCFSGA